MRFLLLVCMVCALFSAQQLSAADQEESEETTRIFVSYSDLRESVDTGKVVTATIWNEGWWVTGMLSDGTEFETRINPSTPIADRLVEAGVYTNFMYKDDEEELPLALSLFFNILPLLIFLGFFWFIILRFKSKNNSYYARAEKMQTDFFDRLDKRLGERKSLDG